MNIQDLAAITFDAATVGVGAKATATVALKGGSRLHLSGDGALAALFGFAMAFGVASLDDDTIAAILRQLPSMTGQPLPSWVHLPPEGGE